MKIYYFIHLVGRDTGNSGIPRVSRNLAKSLNIAPEIELVPVRWNASTSEIVHVEDIFIETMQLHNGPSLDSGGIAGTAVHLDPSRAEWLLIPEVPHLGSHDPEYPSVHLPLLLGYTKQHDIQTAAIFHDAMPLTHFGEETAGTNNGLGFMVYTQGLAEVDVILPVSRASSEALTALFARYGIAVRKNRHLQPVLLPEELIGKPGGIGNATDPALKSSTINFCMWGTTFPHKNYIAAMEAFNELQERRPDLDLYMHHIGSLSSESVDKIRRQIRRSEGHIKLHGFVSDEELTAIVRKSRASLFVSLAEGYGLPLSESLWLGLPCITSNFAPMSEIAAGGGAMLVDPTDVGSIADAMEQIATDSSTYHALKAQLSSRSFRTWADYGDDVLAALASASSVLKDSLDGLHYTSRTVSTSPVLTEILSFGIEDMSCPELYAKHGFSLIGSGKLDYIGEKHFGVPHQVICFGPYVTLGPGKYIFSFDGQIEGPCLIRITSQKGQKIHLETIIDDLQQVVEITSSGNLESFEILFLKTPELKKLNLETIWAERYII